MWRTPAGVAANVVVALVVLSLTIGNAFSGSWFYVALGTLILVGFGVAPAYGAWKAGALLTGAIKRRDP